MPDVLPHDALARWISLPVTARELSAADRWKRAREVFDAVVDLPPSERDRRLDTLCAGDPDLRTKSSRCWRTIVLLDDTLHRIVINAAAEAADEAERHGAAVETSGGGAARDRALSHPRSARRRRDGRGVDRRRHDARPARRAEAAAGASRGRSGCAAAPAAGSARGGDAEPSARLRDPRGRRWTDGRPYIAMELIDGDTLTTRIQRGPLKVADVLTLGRQAASALRAAHALGVVHRDLKPSNIMFTGHGIKLLDFGLASVARDAASGGSGLPPAGFMGTVPYMSPEQVRAEAVDHRTDLFSLGAVLYEAATGRLPFDAPSARETCEAILTREPAPPSQWTPHLPAALERVIMRALAKPRDARYQSAAELGDDLAAIDRRSEVRAPAQRAPSSSPSPRRLPRIHLRLRPRRRLHLLRRPHPDFSARRHPRHRGATRRTPRRSATSMRGRWRWRRRGADRDRRGRGRDPVRDRVADARARADTRRRGAGTVGRPVDPAGGFQQRDRRFGVRRHAAAGAGGAVAADAISARVCRGPASRRRCVR